MTSQSKVLTAALTFVIVSLITILVITQMSGPAGLGARFVRFSLTCALAYFLVKGRMWARLVGAIAALLSAGISVISALSIPAERLPAAFLAWGYIMVAVYGLLFVFLAFSKSAREYFDPKLQYR